VLVAQPEFNQRKRVELATALALAQLRQDLVREHSQQLPSLAPIVKQRNDVCIEARGVEGSVMRAFLSWRADHAFNRGRVDRHVRSFFII
jgi:hypothetical protein